jgi:crotonobetainyl-CoA:carnitine CoA-transferase CaiB-like acyl-CoA transferase
VASEAHKSGILSGLKIIECGEGISAAFAAKTMADLGVSVIKIEPPSGHLACRWGPFPNDQFELEKKGGLFLYLNNNKALFRKRCQD